MGRLSPEMSFQSAKRPSLSDFEYGAYGMSLNLNCVGKLDVDGPQPPSGLSLIGGSENEAMVVAAGRRDDYIVVRRAIQIFGLLSD